MKDTGIITFRFHKNMKSWLDYAGQGFTGGKPELLRLIIMRATMEQPPNSGLRSFLGRIIENSRQPSIGSTAVYAVRLPVDIINSAREIAAGKHIGVLSGVHQLYFDGMRSLGSIKKRIGNSMDG